ncbi:High-affinity nitrate transporter 2.1 [Rhizophlyctis rosea]|uniref:High-affinity nitrate transporter 2.1 n=1 Tax=Rhizophlyctis rosea TaxID=64517 RepID=A0AAD5X6F8_9FUNG|nr:High-affinity nitrate transporter 2.1 [Rhizophlyctis rosea]
MGKKSLPLDASGKALAIHLFSLNTPHMRAFHLSWLGFFSAFTAWFALNPLLKSTIAPDLGITAGDVASSDIANVGSTIFFRLAVGFVTDKVGPRNAMAAILIGGAIPLVLTGLVRNLSGLLAVRAFVGLLGATFVPCQYWTTAFFAKKIVGTANAVVGGWGNMGGGATFLIMPHVYNGIRRTGLSVHDAWRVSLVVPTAICLIVAGLVFFIGTDGPEATLPVAASLDSDSDDEVVVNADGSTSFMIKEDRKKDASAATLHEVNTVSVPPAKTLTFKEKAMPLVKALATPTIIVMMFQYACSFGVEISVDSQIGHYLQSHFKGSLDQTMAGNIGSVFGMMNLFSRASGGMLSDFFQRKFGIKGRIAIQTFLLAANGCALLAFSYLEALGPAVAAMVFFSYFCQAACGSTFGIVPYIAQGGMGAASGLVGAGGTLGGFVFNIVFKKYIDTPNMGFRVMAVTVLVSAVCSAIVNVRGVYVWGKKNLRHGEDGESVIIS